MELPPKALPLLCAGVEGVEAAKGVAEACCWGLPNREEVAGFPNIDDAPCPVGVLEVAGVPKGVGVADEPPNGVLG